MKTYKITATNPGTPSLGVRVIFDNLQSLKDAQWQLVKFHKELTYCQGIGDATFNNDGEIIVENTSGNIEVIYKIEEE